MSESDKTDLKIIGLYEENGNLPEEQKIHLKRDIGLISAINLILNLIIGSGIFLTPGTVLSESGSIGMSLLVWFLSGIISLMGALAFAELSTVVPKSGGSYAYFQTAFKDLHPFLGPLPGFLFIWIMMIIVVPADLAVVALLFANYVYEPVRPSLSPEFHANNEVLVKNTIAAATLVAVGIINYVSVKLYLNTQNLISFLKLSGCAFVIVGGIYMLISGKALNINFGFEGTKTTPHSLAIVFYAGLYSYDGWSWVTGVTEEIKNPDKNIIRSILIGLLIVTLLFISMNVAYTTTLTVDEIISGSAVAVEFGDRVFGPGKIVVSIAVALSALGAALSLIFYASRLGYVAAREGQMWEFICFIHRRRLTPAPAVILQVVLGLGYLFLGRGMDTLINFYMFLMWIFYGLTMATVFVLRRRMPSANRPFKVPLVIPAIVIVLSTALAVIPIFTQPPMQYIVCLLLTSLGVLFYYPFIYKRMKLPYLDDCQRVLQKWMDVIPAKEEPPL
ncbi:b(0,+)-type amino acid transporter 1-like [Macrosteles quadrilineatus]|uniref:b(0,+)-type amino acid transporter 1-like n=1 Tax=Macrosteles quadrilineatus TaxID=74068 RepID=UPI0023E2A659|nr:b(0,+)-type amino acid transporter 1-like [Macrosteles quadrilineatus]